MWHMKVFRKVLVAWILWEGCASVTVDNLLWDRPKNKFFLDDGLRL